MRLKQLRLSGFKSFCDDTVLQFNDEGISVIIGPNGCGKSNVVDAIRWALGEQSPRFLRGGAMSDVIFNGSATRKPVGRAEVTIVFDNTSGTALEMYKDYAEISVTRRLFRSGDSEYLINNTPARLKDIRDLVMDTGAAGRSYSIVEQGKVDQFIVNTPAERRIFLEEAAGIVRFKTRRIAAEKRLDQTRQNLTRVADVLGEVGRREEELRDQVEKAKAFLELRDEVARLAGQLNRVRYQKAARKYHDMESAKAKVQEDMEKAAGAHHTTAARLEAAEAEMALMEQQLRAMREDLFAKERDIQAQESKVALARQDQENVKVWIAKLESDREELKTRRLRLEEEQAGLRQEISGMEAEEQAFRRSVEQAERDFREREALRQSIEAKALEAGEQLQACHIHLTGAQNNRRHQEERIHELTRRLEAMGRQREQTQGERDAAAQAMEGVGERARQAAAQKDACVGQLEGLAARGEEAAARLESARVALRELEREEMDCRSRLEALREINAGYEGFTDTVREVLQWADAHPQEKADWGLLGPLADHIQVSSNVLEWAGSYLAPYLETLVVSRADAVGRMEERLRSEGLGQVKLVALEGIVENPLPPVENSLAAVVAFPPRMAQLGQRLFGQVGVLPESAGPFPLPSGAGNGNGREWLGHQGRFHISHKAVFSMGAAQPPSVGVVRRRQEISTLEEKQTSMESVRAERSAQVDKHQEELTQVETLRRDLEQQRQQHALDVSRLEQESLAAGRELERLKQSLDRIAAESAEIEAEKTRTVEQQAAQAKAAEEWEEKKGVLERELVQVRAQEAAAREEANAIGQRMTESRVAHARALSILQGGQTRLNTLAVDLEEAANRWEEAGEQLAAQAQKLEQAAQNIELANQARAQGLRELEQMKGVVKEREDKHADGETLRVQLAEQVKETRKVMEQTQEKHVKLDISMAEERTRMQQFAEMLGEADQPAMGAEGPLEEVDEREVESKWNKGRKAMEAMEGVNLAAPEEYKALKDRMEFLGQQKGDLEKAIADLEESIRHMNIETRKRFKETFDQVNEKFQEVFPKVFGGGHARLVLTDSEDLLLAGVDIEAEPPGKKLSGLNLLSGGEKALTAISLIFSFFLIKPSPFCLLDEVDAPLDDANVGRFNRLVQSVMDRSQFIIITHNRRTMEIGDLLYGVTMEEDGVSKLVSVNLSGRNQA
ncbi:MAG: chromosome segregation protein SMC [Deltaproteobacteria bacterium]|nr:chromosome segregation protein SMC [Deltaproteobacteria bacterium]